MSGAVPFVHLRVHSEYSVADSIIKVRELAGSARRLRMPAIALTDRGNLFGLIKFYQACLDAGVKPLIGADLECSSDIVAEPCRCAVLAMNPEGYQSLLHLVSDAYVDTEVRGQVTLQQLERHNAGLILLSGGREGEVGRALLKDDGQGARSSAAHWSRIFEDRFYLELTRTGRPQEEAYIGAAVTLAEELELPVLATNDVCFIDADDFEAHETRVCVYDGRTLDDPRRERRYSVAQHLKSPAEMAELFADLPEALANTVAVAERCNMTVDLGTYHLPNYPTPDGESLESYLERSARAGLEARLNKLAQFGAQAVSVDAYEQRLSYELGIINQMGFAGYFLIVMEFIGWARENDIPVGPGRGSGAGSLVSYSLGITDLDPLRYDLLFERFLNPERVSMPDFDVDFCMEGRDRVIQHVSERYGQDAVSQIITFGTMAAKAVVRDVARVQGKPYGLADKLSKLIPFEVGMTLEKAMEQSKELREFVEESDEVGEIMDMAYKLEGIVRGVGRHAGGVVIAPSRLADFVPLYVDELSGGLVSQFDKDDVESAGLVKFDFLGLKTLTIIDWAVRAVNGQREDSDLLDIDRIPLDDPATYALMKRLETTAVFQLESHGMQQLIRDLKPDCIDDIIALVALFRPGPLQSGAVEDYINRKHGREPVTYPHPVLEGALKGTYGVTVYQEQVMQIAQDLAGFTLGQADLLRRAMGKKKPEEMANVRQQFLQGTEAKGVDADVASEIFDLMEKFAGYAFNKCHSAPYALVAYQTAWLKTHYPAEFMAATLSADMQNIDKVVTLVDEVRRMGLVLRTPSVNDGEFQFSSRDGTVIYGLGAVRGVGAGPVSALCRERETAGPFASLRDFCFRVDAKKANRRVLEALIRSGAMDDFALAEETLEQTRARLMAELEEAMLSAEQTARDQEAGMTDLFGGVAGAEAAPVPRRVTPTLSRRERLEGEKEALGLYLTGHPIEDYLDEIRQFCTSSIAALGVGKRSQVVAGAVVSVRSIRSRRGGELAFLELDDRSGRISASLLPQAFEKFKHKIGKDAVLVMEGEVQLDRRDDRQFQVEQVYTIAEAREKFSDAVQIDCASGGLTADLSQRLKQLLTPYREVQSGCPVAVLYTTAGGDGMGAQGRIVLGRDWQVAPSDDLLEGLRAEFGSDQVTLCYSAR